MSVGRGVGHLSAGRARAPARCEFASFRRTGSNEAEAGALAEAVCSFILLPLTAAACLLVRHGIWLSLAPIIAGGRAPTAQPSAIRHAQPAPQCIALDRDRQHGIGARRPAELLHERHACMPGVQVHQQRVLVC